jgi:PleD family two-component response regulator
MEKARPPEEVFCGKIRNHNRYRSCLLGSQHALRSHTTRYFKSALRQGVSKQTLGGHMPENTGTVLLVDDEPVVVSVLAKVLTLHGYTVLVAEDYYTALQAAESHAGRIDLLLTDIALPGLNGCELARKLLRVRPELRVLLMSGYTGAEIC